MREGGTANGQAQSADSDEPPWGLIAPFGEGDDLGLGWVLESLGPVRGGAATMVLRHGERDRAGRDSAQRGAPLGVEHTTIEFC